MKDKDQHVHDHEHEHHHHGSGNLAFAFFLNLGFAIFEFFGGMYTNSMAIMSDAMHDFGDSMSLGVAWFMEKKSEKRRDKLFTFGYKRFSILGALITSMVLLVGSVLIIYGAIQRFANPEACDAQGMIVFAIIGVFVNGIAVFRLKKGESLNERAVYLHLLEDVLGWVAVLIGSIVMYYTDWYWIDPTLSILIAIFILYNVFKNIKKVIRIILQGSPMNVDINILEAKIVAINGICGVHHLHVWTIDGQRHVLTAHLVVNSDTSLNDLNSIRKQAKLEMDTLGIKHCTFEMEFDHESCHEVCFD